jgi:multiple sugar transport system permease protein
LRRQHNRQEVARSGEEAGRQLSDTIGSSGVRSDSESEGKERRIRPSLADRLGPRSLPYLLLVPALIFELLIHIIPLAAGVSVSFFELNQFYIRNWLNAPFVGLQNFRIALNFDELIGGALLHSLLITSAFTVLVVGLSWVFGLAAALLVNSEFRGRGWFRALFLIPYALPVYVAVIGWKFMFQEQSGAVNALLVDLLHVMDDEPFWLLGNTAFWSMVMTSLWSFWPFAFLILLAGLQNIPQELYDAARVDGASRWRQFRSITLPLLRPVSLVLVLALFLWTFNDFNVPYVLFGPAPPSAAELISLHIYINSFVNWNFGLGAAMSVMLLLFLIIVSAIYVRALRVGSQINE